MILFRQIVQRDFVGLADCRGQLVSRVAGQLIGLRKQERRAQRILHFLEGLGASRLFFQHPNDMEAVLRLDQIRDLAGGESESCLFELRDGLSLSDPTQVAALVLRSRVLGILFRQVFELAALLDLL